VRARVRAEALAPPPWPGRALLSGRLWWGVALAARAGLRRERRAVPASLAAHVLLLALRQPVHNIPLAPRCPGLPAFVRRTPRLKTTYRSLATASVSDGCVSALQAAACSVLPRATVDLRVARPRRCFLQR